MDKKSIQLSEIWSPEPKYKKAPNHNTHRAECLMALGEACEIPRTTLAQQSKFGKPLTDEAYEKLDSNLLHFTYKLTVQNDFFYHFHSKEN